MTNVTAVITVTTLCQPTQLLPECSLTGYLISGRPVYLEFLLTSNFGVYDNICALYMGNVENNTLPYYKEKGVNKVGCGIAETQNRIAAVCVYKNQP